jgi:hypothetical protein
MGQMSPGGSGYVSPGGSRMEPGQMTPATMGQYQSLQQQKQQLSLESGAGTPSLGAGSPGPGNNPLNPGATAAAAAEDPPTVGWCRLTLSNPR